MRKIALALISLILFSVVTAGAAANKKEMLKPKLTIVGTLPVNITIQKMNAADFGHSIQDTFFHRGVANKQIQLMRLSPNARFIELFSEHVNAINVAHDDEPLAAVHPQFPHDVGMNRVPVLDQGDYNTCATFAATAAIDAVLGQGDYVSQLCNLELGNAIAEENPYYSSGWDGSSASRVLRQINRYGIINKQMQAAGVCAHINEYPQKPHDEDVMHAEISKAEYAQYHEDVREKYTVQNILSLNRIPGDDPSLNNTIRFYTGYVNGEKTLVNVKNAIDEGHRIVAAVFFARDLKTGLLKDYAWDQNAPEGVGGLWRMDNEIQEMVNLLNNEPEFRRKKMLFQNYFGGHEIIITGYDDSQYVNEGGLLKVRNSWGDKAGAHGDYFMTGDYFRTMAIGEAFVLMPR